MVSMELYQWNGILSTDTQNQAVLLKMCFAVKRNYVSLIFWSETLSEDIFFGACRGESNETKETKPFIPRLWKYEEGMEKNKMDE